MGRVDGGRELMSTRTETALVKWCRENHLQLNITKMKETVVDFRGNKNSSVFIGGTEVYI